MHEYRLFDWILLSILVVIYLFSNYSPFSVVRTLFGFVRFSLILSVDTFFNRKVRPLNLQSAVSSQNTIVGYALSRAWEQYFKVTSNELHQALLSGRVQKRLFDIRAFLQAYSGIEDSSYEEFTDSDQYKGLWVKSPCRPATHDLVVFYVPNIMMPCEMPYVYLEYLMTLQSLLLVQGFRSPAVFIMEGNGANDSIDATVYIQKLLLALGDLQAKNPDAKIIFAGDSFGATLVLSLLVLLSREDPETKPFGALLISPMLADKKLVGPLADRVSKFYEGLPELNPMSVTDTDAWRKAAPVMGLIVSYGCRDAFHDNIEDLTAKLAQVCPTKVLESDTVPYAPALFKFVSEDVQDEKEDSAFVYSAILSRMVLWHTTPYFEHKSHEPMNPLTIDTAHT